jgi:hypothetical protein
MATRMRAHFTPSASQVFVRRGLPVPTVYVLPPAGASSYGDIEFPLFWNFFIEAASQQPEKRVVLVGPADQLERVRAVFRESMFGPAPADLCVAEDIAPEARQAGYSVDFYAEQKVCSLSCRCRFFLIQRCPHLY